MAEIYRPQKKDPLEQILTGVQLAAGILNIKGSLQDMSLKEQQAENIKTDRAAKQAEEQRIASGQLRPFEEAEIRNKMMEVPQGTAGAVEMKSPTGAPLFFAPKPVEKPIGDTIARERFEFDKQKYQEEKIASAAKLDLDDKVRADDIKEAFLKDQKTMLFQSGFEASQELQNLLQSEDPIIDAIALRKVFKLSGDVGTIRSEDLQQLGASPALADQALAAVNMALKGDRIQPEQRAALQNFAKNMEANNRIKIEKHAEGFADRMASMTKFKRNEALQYLNPGSLLFSIPVVGRSTERKPGIGEAGAFDSMSDDEAMRNFLSPGGG